MLPLSETGEGDRGADVRSSLPACDVALADLCPRCEVLVFEVENSIVLFFSIHICICILFLPLAFFFFSFFFNMGEITSNLLQDGTAELD